jgi:hypothetical protein
MYVRYAVYGVVALFLFYIGFQTGREDAQANQGCKKAVPAATAQSENFIPSLRGEGEPCDETASLSQPGGGVGMRKVDTYQSFFGGSRQKDTRKTCPNYPDYGQFFLHIKQNHKEMKQVVDSVLNLAFDELHHPPSPANSEIIASQNQKITRYEECSEIYLTRSGARESMPNKCLAIVWANADKVSPWRHSHRFGVQAKMVDRYVDDYLERVNYPEETEELPLVLRGYKQSIEQFKQLLGDPMNADGSRKAVVVMVANEGVMDLVLNFLCSCREKAAGIDISSIAIFLGQPEYVPVVNSMGAHGIFNQFLSQIPKKAAGNYGDKTFGRLMWLKTTSVYIALQAGFDVIFQDADLVWLKDPVPHLHKVVRDVAFMDDGARTPRFTPYFVNSGFYYFKHNPRVLYLMERMLKGGPGEISVSHSHQSVLIRYLTEVHDMNGIKVNVLGSTDFPSGAMYHNNKTFIKRIKEYKEEPFVFHMCWTANREDKVKYLKDLGMWYLPDETNARHNTCEKPQQMIAWAKSAKKGENLLSHCCMAGEYFNNKP